LILIYCQKRHKEIKRNQLQARDRLNAKTPFIWACENGQLETVKYLLAQGSSVKERDRSHRTGLDYAAEVSGWIGFIWFAGRLTLFSPVAFTCVFRWAMKSWFGTSSQKELQ